MLNGNHSSQTKAIRKAPALSLRMAKQWLQAGFPLEVKPPSADGVWRLAWI